MLGAVTASLPILGRSGSSGLLLAAWMQMQIWVKQKSLMQAGLKVLPLGFAHPKLLSFRQQGKA